MGIIFRVDVDKPYGHHSFIRKVASKLHEDYEIPFKGIVSYLPHLKAMLTYLNERGVPAFFYFRNCTTPDKETLALLQAGKHQMGFHAENTRSMETFGAEINKFEQKAFKVIHFTKHGSGILKLGKYHYPPFEPEKYKKWAKQLGIAYFSGNDIPEKPEQLVAEHNFWKTLFWLEKDYRHADFNSPSQFIEIAKEHDVILLTHPENFFTHKEVRDDLDTIIQLSRKEGITWHSSLDFLK